jgi:hypothetical protein
MGREVVQRLIFRFRDDFGHPFYIFANRLQEPTQVLTRLCGNRTSLGEEKLPVSFMEMTKCVCKVREWSFAVIFSPVSLDFLGLVCGSFLPLLQ